MIQIEKRLPFGFKGQWGKVYKSYVYDVDTAQDTIQWRANSYADIGQDVQFKYLGYGADKTIDISQPVMNLIYEGNYRFVKTTDAYFNTISGNFECVASLNDIVYLFGCYWEVDKMEERSVYTPEKQTFYYLGLKKIFDEVLTSHA